MSNKSAIKRLGLIPLTLVITTIVVSVRTIELTECANGVTGFINNNRENCDYAWIYCNGENSMYCSDNTCDENFFCAIEPSVPDPEQAPAPVPAPVPVPPSSPPDEITTVTPQTVTKTANVRSTCQRGVFDNYPYPRNCNYYYQCVDGYLIVQQCPFGFHYDDSREVCTNTPNARCNNFIK